MPRQKIIRTGNSLAVTIPAHLVRELGVRAGNEVEVKSEAGRSRMVCNFSGSGQLVLGEEFLGKRKKKRVMVLR